MQLLSIYVSCIKHHKEMMHKIHRDSHGKLQFTRRVSHIIIFIFLNVNVIPVIALEQKVQRHVLNLGLSPDETQAGIHGIVVE